MRRLFDRHRLLAFFAVLGFVAGQWFAVIHATQHELSSNDTDGCQICAVAHATGGAPTVLAVPIAAIPRSIERSSPVPETFVARPLARPHSRGPPAFLA